MKAESLIVPQERKNERKILFQFFIHRWLVENTKFVFEVCTIIRQIKAIRQEKETFH